ncbi:LysR family transcriptional regulator [Klebsiella sp. BIGb0407]|uniref:LysR family transcriptional regulator n=1 Tax=Klebsiella sp. BIGb0407 TaxID=2940603 RepID=UPI0021682CC7|nr:LysR family transcriptional regulator [Klebsiella sp. BIGb0407]MCS3432823.1 DNA-binding transcriptional LysR family regulator [Klebsiella sp. BIGb0407]
MDIKLLRAFVTLARLGWYHPAAEILCVTQPALTKQIQTLENLTGATLFQRGRHGAKLTVAGELLLPGASEVLARYDLFWSEVTGIRKGNAGKLVLGFGISSFRLAPERVAAFRSQHPDVQVSLNDMPSAVQFQQLAEGQLQVGFVRLPAPEQLESRILAEERLVLAVAADSYSDSSDMRKLIEKNQLLQISPKRGEGLSAQASCFLAENNLTPQRVSAADDIQTLLALVAGGGGVALLPESVIHILPAGIMLVPLEGKHTAWQTGIAWNAGIKDPVRDNFLTVMAVQ